MADVDSMVIRLVATEELAAAQMRESFIPAWMFTDRYPALPRECGIDFDLGRRFVLLDGESGDTASIHAVRIAQALGLTKRHPDLFPANG